MTDPNRTSVGDVPAPTFLDDKEFMGRVSARMTQAGYSESDAMRIVHAGMQHDAVNAERAAVVKYLRERAHSFEDHSVIRIAFLNEADDIEKGVHIP